MTNQVELAMDREAIMPPDPPWRIGSQCYRLYMALAFEYIPGNVVASWVGLDRLAKILPGGVTRRIDDLRKRLRPLGWDVVNRMDRVDGDNCSWYRLCRLGAERSTG